MMKKLDWYLAKKFISTVVFILGLTALISVVFDVAEKTEDFIEHKVPAKVVIFDYYLNFIPSIINLISPLVIFIAALYFTSRLANNSEIIAMLSAGISYKRLLRPYIVVGIFLALVDMGMKNFIFPKAHAAVLDFELSYITWGYDYQQKNIHRRLQDGGYFYAESIQYAYNRAFRFSYEKFKDNQLVYKVRASEAFYDSTHNDWIVRNYMERHIDGMTEKVVTGDSLRMKIPITIAEFGQKARTIPGMTTPELNKAIEEEKLKGADMQNFYLIEKYKRLAMPVDIIVLIIIAVSLSTRKVRGGVGTHLLLGILIAVSHELFVRFSTTFSTNASLPPILGVWIPTVVYGLIALYTFRVAQK